MPDLPRPDLPVPDAQQPDAQQPDAQQPDAQQPDSSWLDGFVPDANPGSGTVTRLVADPFGDKTTFAHVFKYQGLLYFGPYRTGVGAIRMNPDGSALAKVVFSFPADTNKIGTTTDNASSAPYPGIGFTGCTKDTSQCGPDNEDGRGVFTAGTINGKEWLLITGGKTGGGLNYVQMTQDTDATLDFRYVDLDERLGGGTHSTSAVHFFGDRIYLGLPDSGGSRPYLVVLKTTPGVPGLDVDDKELYKAEDLEAHDMPNFDSANPAMIDTLTDLNARLYVFNHGGCMRSTRVTPRDYKNYPGDWASCTPGASQYTTKTAVTLSKTQLVDVQPMHKAFPQAAVYRGRLYVGRNTTAGPQLWVCEPGRSGSSTDCDPGDWSLVAPNTSGDRALSQFNNPNNARVSFVAATPGHLYVGYDNAKDGIVVLRSSSSAPAAVADFFGHKGCPASGHPATCPGLGGNGLGAASNVQIMDGQALTFKGQEFVYLSVGSSTGGLTLFRVID